VSTEYPRAAGAIGKRTDTTLDSLRIVVAPTPQTETLFMASVNSTIGFYRHSGPAAGGERIRTGRQGVRELVRAFSQKDFRDAAPALRADILAFFGGSGPSPALAKNPQEWRDTQRAIEKLRAVGAGATLGK
jgi:hypothetical protein